MADMQDETLVRLHGTVAELDQRNTSSGGTVLGALVRCQAETSAPSGSTRLWPGRLPVGQQLLWPGSAPRRHVGNGPSRVEIRRRGRHRSARQTVAGLSADRGLRQGHIRRIAAGVVESLAEHLDEVFPASTWQLTI